MSKTSSRLGRLILPVMAFAAAPALLPAQQCLGFAAAGPVPAVELSSAFVRDGIYGPTTLGANLTLGNLFAIVETGADYAAGTSALAPNGLGGTIGASMKGPGKLALCAAASRSSESVIGGTSKASAAHLAAGLPFPILSKLLPLTAYGVVTYEDRTTTFTGGTGVGDAAETGLAIRTGVAYYPVEWLGLRMYEDYDVDRETQRFGMGVSVRFPLGTADADRDGVPDAKDRCPNTPAGTRVNAQGCPLDSDGDGVIDANDRCPNTPAGMAVNAQGCPLDSDGDGVIDANDRCPNTPAGTAVNAQGCPLDSDGDGVIDAKDKCPNTPVGTAVNADGCPLDSDGDGVIDAKDKCPNTPAGTAVNADGCPLDADGDGVLDAADACPNTPAGTAVDTRGCPKMFADGNSFLLTGVTFETSKSIIRPSSFAKLDEVAEALRNNPDVRVEISGHTDNAGTAAGNAKLSQSRAEAVRQYFINKGIAGDRMVARGYGESRPVATNATPEGMAQNRRVEMSKINP